MKMRLGECAAQAAALGGGGSQGLVPWDLETRGSTGNAPPLAPNGALAQGSSAGDSVSRVTQSPELKSELKIWPLKTCAPQVMG